MNAAQNLGRCTDFHMKVASADSLHIHGQKPVLQLQLTAVAKFFFKKQIL